MARLWNTFETTIVIVTIRKKHMYDAYEEGRGCIDNVHNIVESEAAHI